MTEWGWSGTNVQRELLRIWKCSYEGGAFVAEICAKKEKKNSNNEIGQVWMESCHTEKYSSGL